MQRDPHYEDVVAEVAALLFDRAPRPARPGSTRCGSTRASASGSRSTTTSACWPAWTDLVATGLPGDGRHQPEELSRRPGAGTGAAGRRPSPTGSPASLATATWAMQQGAAMVRVHDVAATVQAA